MPNHFHALLLLLDSDNSPSSHINTNTIKINDDSINSFASPKRTIGSIVRGIKSCVTTRINTDRKTPKEPVWQGNYYEHVLREEHDVKNIRAYILNNPLQWSLDELNPYNGTKQIFYSLSLFVTAFSNLSLSIISNNTNTETITHKNVNTIIA